MAVRFFSALFFLWIIACVGLPFFAEAAITFKSEGSIDSSGAAQHLSTPVYPANVVAGDLLIMFVGMKPSAANGGTVTTPSGWTLLASTTAGGYNTTLGIDTGNTHLFAYSRIADGTGRDNRLQIVLSQDNITWATIQVLSGTLGGWDVATTTGAQNSTPVSPLDITFGADPGVTAGDYVFAAFSTPTDVGAGAQFSSESFTQTGVTFGTVVESAEIATATGNDTGGLIVRAPVSSGTGSAAPHVTSTLTGTLTNVRGPAVFVRVREAAAPGVPVFYNDDGEEQIAFKGIRQNDTTPIVRVSATHSGSFNQFEVEFNTSSDFSGTSYTDTFSGVFSSDTQYNLQTTESLGLPTTDGVTYFIRARASEDGGSHYGAWSTANLRSFTYTSSGNPTWFQTTDEQFNEWTTATGTRRTGTGRIQIASTPYIRGWTSGASEAPSTSLTLDKPASTRPGDLLLILVGNDDSTATAQWDNSTLKPHGFTLINEAGGSTPDAHAAAFYRIADGTEQTSTTTTAQSADDYWGYYLRVVGVSTTSPLDVAGADTLSAAAVTSLAITGITSTVANTLAFYVHGYDGGDGNPFGISGTGWAKEDGINATGGAATDANAAGGSWGTRVTAAIESTGSATVSSAVSDGFSGFLFNIRPSNLVAGTIMSPEIDFDWVPGSAGWDAATFSTTETNGDVKLRVYYSVSSECDTIVSDGVLPGNSSGFDVATAPIDISGLTPTATTYNKICLEAMLTDSGGTPTLDDWSVSWGAPAVPDLTIAHYRWRADDGNDTGASFFSPEDTALTDGVYVGDSVRLRFVISNIGDGSASDITYRLEHASSTTACSVWQPVANTEDGSHWVMKESGFLLNGGSTAHHAGMTTPGGQSFVSGYTQTLLYETAVHTLASAGYTEHEYSIKSTSLVSVDTTYCFRLTNAGSTTYFSFDVQPQISVKSSARRPILGGSPSEPSGSGSQQTGGGIGGGGGSEGNGGGGQQGGGGAGGGGGDSG